MYDFNFENLGVIKSGHIGLNKLTIFVGDNNCGKTYASYSIYGLLNFLYSNLDCGKVDIKKYIDFDNSTMQLKEFLNDNLDNMLKIASTEFSNKLAEFFSVPKELFKNSSVSVSIPNKADILEKIKKSKSTHNWVSVKTRKKTLTVKNEYNSLKIKFKSTDENSPIPYLFNTIPSIIFTPVDKVSLLPAERAGINIFYKELNVNRNRLMHDLGSSIEKNGLDVIKQIKNSISLYAKPIADYIEFLNDAENYVGDSTSEVFQEISKKISDSIAGGSYTVENDRFIFTPTNSDVKMSLHASSSTAKTLFGLVFYLKHIADKGNTIIIDEPELNLHPDNQRKLARILAEMVNTGINVLISTHSDYIVKEFNNLIMLNNKFKGYEDISKQYGYSDNEFLNPNNVSAYYFGKEAITKLEIDNKEGIYVKTFDDVINSYNNASNDIFYTLQEESENE